MSEKPKLSSEESKEKQSAMNKPLLKEVLLALHFTLLSEKDAKSQLEKSAEKVRMDERLANRAALLAKVKNKLGASFEALATKYLGENLELLIVREEKDGTIMLRAKNLLSLQIVLRDGEYTGTWPADEWNAKFKTSDDAIVWFFERLDSYDGSVRANEKK